MHTDRFLLVIGLTVFTVYGQYQKKMHSCPCNYRICIYISNNFNSSEITPNIYNYELWLRIVCVCVCAFWFLDATKCGMRQQIHSNKHHMHIYLARL